MGYLRDVETAAVATIPKVLESMSLDELRKFWMACKKELGDDADVEEEDDNLLAAFRKKDKAAMIKVLKQFVSEEDDIDYKKIFGSILPDTKKLHWSIP